jgi:D-alanyl-D-alanine carboxypeptidase (penicillin-binding protein 5/6)
LSPIVSLAHDTTATASKLAWPAQGQAAVGILNSSVVEAHGVQQPIPTASTAKLITALTVLGAKPLKPGQPGPNLTIGPNDVAIYNNYVAQDGSVVPVQNGEQISEYQALQALLLPSANNIADSLAIWAFGSLQNYAQAANQFLESEGIVETHVGKDASGFDPSTTSDARDLVKIGQLAMQNPVLTQIVSQSTASGIPVAGTVKNVNFLLGQNGIIGIKTGNTDQAGGVFVSASTTTVNHKPVTIITAVIGAADLWHAMNDSLTLVKSAQANFSTVPVVHAGAVVGSYTLLWGGSVKAVANKTVATTAWNGSNSSPKINLKKIKANTAADSQVGAVSTASSFVSSQASSPITLQSAPTKPPVSWRLMHPF